MLATESDGIYAYFPLLCLMLSFMFPTIWAIKYFQNGFLIVCECMQRQLIDIKHRLQSYFLGQRVLPNLELTRSIRLA